MDRTFLDTNVLLYADDRGLARRPCEHVTVSPSSSAAGCTRLWSEDLQHGRTIEGVRIENPFAPQP